MVGRLNAENASHCFLDFDIDNHRSKLAKAAAFVHATDSRYGFSSKDIRKLGGSELGRIQDLISTDHEWSGSEIEVKPPSSGNRVVLQLYWDVAPIACENFATLCANGSMGTGGKTVPAPIGESGKPLTYRSSTVHRIIPGFIVQGGDFVFGNGSGGESIYAGKKFKDERAGLQSKHDRRGVLSMGNSGKNSNSSQWFITFEKAPQCDGKHVVFGTVVSGFDVIAELEKCGTGNGSPTRLVTVTDCGLWSPIQTPGAGFWFDQPDPESYSGISPVFVVRPRVAVLVPNEAAGEKFSQALSTRCTVSVVVVKQSHTDLAEIHTLLIDFAVDVVLVAPACQSIILDIDIPSIWTKALSRDSVLIVSKPVSALAAVHKSSWLLSKGWQVDL